jgi:hypothetical protein
LGGCYIAMAQNDSRPIPLSDLSARELRARARQYCEMANSAKTAVVHASLLRLAERFEVLADKKEADTKEADTRDAGFPDT